MPDRPYRVLAVATHPVQYMTPIFRRMAKHPSLDFQVAYGTLRGAEASHDPEFLIPMTFSGMQAYEDFVLNAYFWLLLGILFRLPTIGVSARYAAAAQLPPMYDPQIRML